ncbi:MAG: conjugal transfer pilus assembly protein TraK [Burkholderiaceae bacterium]|jgi:conjugal transfer pilus assembly protein TraK|nr:MAG: conjugal transfer pilus assembly protein TraK [Burkholderiaceae bacterium]
MRLPEFAWPGVAVAVALTVALAGPAHALQVVDGRDGIAIEAIVSIKEPTRIRIEGSPITDVFGNIYSSSCGGPTNAVANGAPLATNVTPATSATIATPAVNPTGEVVLECDRDKGEIYIRPVGESGKPVNLFVSSAHATYTLVLRRADTPADTIVIRDRTPRAVAPIGATTPSAALGASAHHVRALKALLVAMASSRFPADVRVEELDQPVRLWAEARLALVGRFEGRNLVGERYRLTNASDSIMVLAEQEFDRPDTNDGGQVLGVAIDNHNLRPGETTSIYVIRRGGTR